MRHPWSIPVLLAAAALAGYAAGARPLQAQSEQWPMGTGELVTMTFPGGQTRQCAVEEFRGSYVRCGSGQRQPLSIGQRERPEDWINLAQLQGITRPRPDR